MKIDGHGPAHEAQATDGTTRTGRDASVRPGGVPAAGTPADRVELSSEAGLRTAALRAAEDASGIRTDLVERMRELLDAGRVGSDSRTLADAIIDDLLK